jgi:MFS transporter, DHA1 family, inner membrane transport protein
MAVPMSLFVLFLGSFCLGTAEFMATGLLPQVAADIGVSIPTAGAIVTAYALGVAFGGPILAVLFGRLPRKAVLIALLLLFASAQVLCAVAPSFELLLAGRVLGAACQGAFFGIAGIVAISVAGPGKSGVALSLLVAGITVANILGLPGGTMIGSAFGWRTSFVALGGVAVLVAVLVLLFIPTTATEATGKASLRRQLGALAQSDVVLSYAVMTLASLGFFAVFTYVTPLLTTVTGVPEDIVPVLLLAFGVGSTVGAFAGGRLADWKPLPAVIGLMAAEMVVFTTVLVFADSAIAMAVAVVALGFCAFSYAPSLFVRLFKAAGDAADLASALISTAFNVGIAAGAAIGGAMLSAGAGYQHLGIVGFVTAALAICAVLTMQARARREELQALVALTA